MTGRKPTRTTELAVWSGAKMKDATKVTATIDLLERHCARLQHSLQRLHEAVRARDEARLRRKAIRAARDGPGQRFNVGDFAMVTASHNQANPERTHKVCVHWQGPYEVVGGAGPTEYEVRLLGDEEVHTVH